MYSWIFFGGMAAGFFAAEAIQIIMHRENLQLLRAIAATIGAKSKE